MKREVLRIENATIERNGIVYLENFSIHISEGEIVGMIGKTHHGIEELIGLICNNFLLKYGRVYLKGILINTYLRNVKRNNKVYLIEQKSRLVGDLTVTDNIFVLRKGFKKYVVNEKALAGQVIKSFKKLGVDINPSLPAKELSPFERCVVELVKAALLGTNLIIIKEISEVLSSVDLQRFYKLMQYYVKTGISFLYIANHHEEMSRICTRLVIYNEGKIKKILFENEVDSKHIEPFIEKIKEPVKRVGGKKNIVLEYRSITTGNLSNFSFQATQGECLALLDCNNTSLYDIVHTTEVTSISGYGEVLLEGVKMTRKRNFLIENICVIPENPMKNSIFSEMTYMENLCFLIDRKIKQSIIKRNYYESIRKEYKKELGDEIDVYRLEELAPKSIYNLIYYRVLLYRPKVVFIFQPFSGADMYLRKQIARLINRLKSAGITIIILTSQMTDILAVSDRLLLIKDGNINTNHQKEKEDMIYSNYYGHRFQIRQKRCKNKKRPPFIKRSTPTLSK